MRRGEIWWTEQPEPIGKRPVLLLSRDDAYSRRNAVTVAQITTKLRNIPVEVFLDKRDGVSKKCVINLDTITTIRKSLLVERVGLLRNEKMRQVTKALKFALDLE